MPTYIQGRHNAAGMKFAIVVSRFNHIVTDQLLATCVEALTLQGAIDENITIASVPGAFEIPFCAQKLARSANYDAIICLGAVIRGDTPHFDYICSEVSHGIAQVSLQNDIPVVFGVLTTNTLEEALGRADGRAGSKGAEAGMTAIEMADLRRKL